jgi:hypothetical protein
MTLRDLLENLGMDVLDRNESKVSLEGSVELLEQEIEVHYQPNYPLKTGIAVVKYDEELNCISIALSEGGGYGSRKAWEEE